MAGFFADEILASHTAATDVVGRRMDIGQDGKTQILVDHFVCVTERIHSHERFAEE
jgi:hypothetical protein